VTQVDHQIVRLTGFGLAFLSKSSFKGSTCKANAAWANGNRTHAGTKERQRMPSYFAGASCQCPCSADQTLPAGAGPGG
jgi:hypothetical protein